MARAERISPDDVGHLRAPEVRLEDLYQDAPVALCAVDHELRYVHANAEYAAIVGRSVGELIGRGMGEVVHRSARDDAVALAARVVRSGEPASAELRRRASGQPAGDRIWLAKVCPIVQGGEVVGATAALQDVTSLRRAEERARAQLRELESVYRNAPVGLSFMDRDLRYVRVNQVIADTNGLSVDEVVGKTYRDLAPETADLAEPFLRATMESGSAVRNLEVRARPAADPEVEHVYLLSLDPVRDGQGAVIGHTAAVQDVTELRRAEEIAARRLHELELLYAHTPASLCYVDHQLRVVHLNPLFAELSERPAGQHAGRPVGELLSQELADQLVPQMRYVARSGAHSVGLEVRGRLPVRGRPERTWISHSHPVRAEAGIIGVITVLQDVTPLVDRQHQIEAVRDRLVEAQRVARVGSWEWNLLDDEIWWSREQYEIFGEPTSWKPSYDGFFEHVHPDDRPKVREQIERTLQDGEPPRLVYRVARRDGTLRTLFTVARLERTAEGLPARLLGTCQDVTDFIGGD